MSHIVVRHYGPENTEDPDHGTSISIRRGRFTRVMVLESDAELDSLIRKLQAAKLEGDGVDGAQRT